MGSERCTRLSRGAGENNFLFFLEEFVSAAPPSLVLHGSLVVAVDSWHWVLPVRSRWVLNKLGQP